MRPWPGRGWDRPIIYGASPVSATPARRSSFISDEALVLQRRLHGGPGSHSFAERRQCVRNTDLVLPRPHQHHEQIRVSGGGVRAEEVRPFELGRDECQLVRDTFSGFRLLGIGRIGAEQRVKGLVKFGGKKPTVAMLDMQLRHLACAGAMSSDAR